MINLFKTKPKKIAGDRYIFRIDGMHCVSCALNIDAELENLAGVEQAQTKYASQQTVVWLNLQLISPEEVGKIIKELGYQASA